MSNIYYTEHWWLHAHLQDQGPFLLAGINFNPGMDN